MKNIILIGMMGCGKTTCGGLLSRRLDRELVDTDALIAAREGRSIPEIFAAQGEDRFRELERGVAEELARREGLVVACGGGLPLRDDAMAPLKSSGTVVFLCRDPGETFDTVPMDARPLAQQVQIGAVDDEKFHDNPSRMALTVASGDEKSVTI